MEQKKIIGFFKHRLLEVAGNPFKEVFLTLLVGWSSLSIFYLFGWIEYHPFSSFILSITLFSGFVLLVVAKNAEIILKGFNKEKQKKLTLFLNKLSEEAHISVRNKNTLLRQALIMDDDLPSIISYFCLRGRSSGISFVSMKENLDKGSTIRFLKGNGFSTNQADQIFANVEPAFHGLEIK